MKVMVKQKHEKDTSDEPAEKLIKRIRIDREENGLNI